MPKIITDLKNKLLEETRRQIHDSGYAATTVRSVAKACGVGVGTVYNYFPSKDTLIATYLLEDWNTCIQKIEHQASVTNAPRPVVLCIYQQLLAFADRHKALFQDKDAASSFSCACGKYHRLLRKQLAQPLLPFCTNEFAALFVAESLLTWSMAGSDFSDIYDVLEKIFPAGASNIPVSETI